MGSKHLQINDSQLDQIAQNELGRMQRQFRVMELDREASSDEVKRIICKQRQVLSQLEKEKAELQTLLSCAENKAFSKKQEVKIKELQALLKEHDDVECDIRREGKELKDLEAKTERVVKEVIDLRNKHRIQDSNIEQVTKQARTDENLETRLYVETVKFNKLISDNQKMRQEIDHLLIERGQFNQMFQQLVGKLNSGKKVLMDLIEQSTMAYDKREEALTKLEALRSRAKQDLLQHSQEMRELRRKLDHETKLHDFVGAKGAKRVNVDLEALQEYKKRQDKEKMELHLQEFKAIIEQIKIFFNETDVERLASSFLKLEEDNYNLFSFINELNKELGVLREQVCEVREKIDEQSETNKKTAEEQKASLITLKDELAVRTREADGAEDKLKQCQKIVQNLLDGIHSVFKFIQCDPSPALQLLGLNSVVTVYNCMLYLNILEKRVIDIVDLVWYLAYSKVAVRAARLFPGQVSFLREPIMSELPLTVPQVLAADKVVPSQPCPLCTEQEDISEVDESIAAPMQKEELIEFVKSVMFEPQYEDRLHNVSACRLPKSRRIMQRRFQN